MDRANAAVSSGKDRAALYPSRPVVVSPEVAGLFFTMMRYKAVRKLFMTTATYPYKLNVRSVAAATTAPADSQALGWVMCHLHNCRGTCEFCKLHAAQEKGSESSAYIYLVITTMAAQTAEAVVVVRQSQAEAVTSCWCSHIMKQKRIACAVRKGRCRWIIS